MSPHRFRHTLYSGVWLSGGAGSEKAAIAMLRMSIRSNMSLRSGVSFGNTEGDRSQGLLHPILPMEIKLIACRIRFDVPLFLGDRDIGYCGGPAI